MFSIEPPVSHGKDYRKEFAIFYFLEKNINSAELQIERIKTDIENIDKEFSVIRDNLHETTSINKYHAYLFIDIHFLLISIANIGKNMEILRDVMSRDSDFVKICKAYKNRIEKIDNFRDNLEHIIDRLNGKDKSGNPLKDPNDFGNLIKDIFTFGGESLSINSCFSLIEWLSRDIIAWQASRKLIDN